jgi:hypothetical protein
VELLLLVLGHAAHREERQPAREVAGTKVKSSGRGHAAERGDEIGGKPRVLASRGAREQPDPARGNRARASETLAARGGNRGLPLGRWVRCRRGGETSRRAVVAGGRVAVAGERMEEESVGGRVVRNVLK